MFLTLSFGAVLKTTLIQSNFETRTMTLDEIIDKDMTVHISQVAINIYSQSDIPLYRRILCQAKKKKSIFKDFKYMCL